VVDLLYEASVEQLLEFFMDKVLLLNGLLLGLLLHQPGVGVDLQMVLNPLPRDPWHLRWLPGKHINIIPEQGDKREFLFVAQVPRNAGGLGSIRADLDNLHGDILIVQGLHAGCRRRDVLVRARWCLVGCPP
jgi:hypothetical protein